MPDFCFHPHLSLRLPSKQIVAATAAVALVVCVALVSEMSFKSKVPTLPSLTSVARWAEWAEAPEAEHQDGQHKITMREADFNMLEADIPVFTMLAGGPGMDCSAPDTCACSASLTPDANVVRIRVAQVLEKDRLSRP
jgi:hypothetical protein